jgi:hypothetical protein
LPSLPIKSSAPGIANCESCKLQRASWASQHQRANDRVGHGSDGAINRQHDECDVRGTRIRDGSALFRPPSPPCATRRSPLALLRSSALLPYLRVVSAGRVHTKLHLIKTKVFFPSLPLEADGTSLYSIINQTSHHAHILYRFSEIATHSLSPTHDFLNTFRSTFCPQFLLSIHTV